MTFAQNNSKIFLIEARKHERIPMLYLLFFALLAPIGSMAAEIAPQEAFFLLVGPNDKQFAACPSPVEIKKDSLATGSFLKGSYPDQKIDVEKPVGNRHRYLVGQKSIELTVITPAEIHWEERGVTKDFKGNLCKRAIYTTNASSQEEIDSMVKEDETVPAGKEMPKSAPKSSMAEKPRKENMPGTILGDGTIAGEAEAMEYFQHNEPMIYAKLSAMDKPALREAYAKEMAWFQRVGNFRKKQKCDSIRKIQTALGLEKTKEAKCVAAIMKSEKK
ncbi:MAG: hypothetical protein ACXWQO_16880 [Bdellovibrionota bacterium]